MLPLITLTATTGIEAEDSAIQLAIHIANDYHSKWSPDGKHIAFASQRTGEAKLFIMPSGDAILVEGGLSADHWFTRSPDSKYLAFDAYGPDGPPPRIWLIPVTGGEAKQLLPDVVPSFHPVVSPDGEWIAFSSLGSDNPDIWKAKLNGDSLTQLTRDPAADHHPQWLPDGGSIVFTSNRRGNLDVWTIDADGTRERQITDAPENDDHASVSPDGS